MSTTFTLSSCTSILEANFFPAIELDKKSSYGLGLLGFYSYNSIFNVDEQNNYFAYNLPGSKNIKRLEIKPGAYEIEEIEKQIIYELKSKKDENFEITEKDREMFTLRANHKTLKCEIKSKFDIITFGKKSLSSILGFGETVLKANRWHESTFPVNIMKVRMIRVDCNISSGAYLNSNQSHALFEFDIEVEHGYKITKEPLNIIYMSIMPLGRQYIDNITLRILDDQNNLVNFQGEQIIVKLELKKVL